MDQQGFERSLKHRMVWIDGVLGFGITYTVIKFLLKPDLWQKFTSAGKAYNIPLDLVFNFALGYLMGWILWFTSGLLKARGQFYERNVLSPRVLVILSVISIIIASMFTYATKTGFTILHLGYSFIVIFAPLIVYLWVFRKLHIRWFTRKNWEKYTDSTIED